MIKTFFVLWIWTGWGDNQTLAVDHYSTKPECEAAREAILKNSTLNPKRIECFEAVVK